MPRVTRLLRRSLAIALLAATLAGCSPKKDVPQAVATPEVGVVTLHASAIPVITELPGRTSPFRVAEVRPQVGGVVRKLLFTEGQNVVAGQQLYQLDPAPFEAALASAQASQDHAVATAASARTLVERYRPLEHSGAISTQVFDNADTALSQSEADVAAAKAAVQTAAINLAFARIVSPIPGRTGRSSVTEGALVTLGQTNSLVTVTQLDPIYVDVAQSSDMFLRLKRALASGQIKTVADNVAEVKLILDDGTTYDHPGQLQFSEVTVNPATGSITLRAVFPNEKGLLLPGMFVQETIEEGIRQNAVLAPQRGVTHDVKGEATALVVGPDGKVALRELTTGRAIGNDWLVVAGLADGDRLIVEGLQKIKPGDAVKAVETAAEIGAPAPTPSAKP